MPGNCLNLIDGASLGARGPHYLDHREIACDSSPLQMIFGGSRRDIVRDFHDADVVTFRTQLLRGLPKMQDVARIVTEHHESAGAIIRGANNRTSLRCRGRGKDVATHRSMRDSRPNPSCKGRIVPRTATHNKSYFRFGTGGGTDHAAVNWLDVIAVNLGEAGK